MTDFTSGELKLMFQRIEEKLDEIKLNMGKQHARYDAEIVALKLEVKETKEEVDLLDRSLTKVMAIGGTIWSAVTLLSGFLLNKIF